MDLLEKHDSDLYNDVLNELGLNEEEEENEEQENNNEE